MFDEFDEEIERLEASASPTVGSSLKPPRQMSRWHGDPAIESQLLELAASDRMPHALIFAGPEGIGKSTMAFRLARFLLKHGHTIGKAGQESGGLFGDELPQTLPESFDLAPEDPVFKLVASGGHPDMLVIEREFDDKKGKMRDVVTVEQARKITPFLRRTASMGGWRLVILDDADTMNRNAQNAILKILEEPPGQSLLILIAHRTGAMIPTIRSRCRVIPFSIPDKEQFTELVRLEDSAIGAADLDMLYSLSAGSVGKALAIHEIGGLEAVARIISLLSGWPDWNWPEIHRLSDSLGGRGSEQALKAFEDVMLWLAESLTKAKARGDHGITGFDVEILRKMLAHYPLEEWIKICENLRALFDTVQHANLDNRHAVLGAFSIFDFKKAA